MNIKTIDTVRIAMCTALMTVTAWIAIPSPVPFTLQTFAVLLVCGLIGGKRATASVLLYIVLGAVGLPVFAGFTGGAAVLLGATGGYIIGFFGSTLFMWGTERFSCRSDTALVLTMSLSLIICYAVGVLWYVFVYTSGTHASFGAVITTTVMPFVIPDAVKLALAAILTKRLKKHLV